MAILGVWLGVAGRWTAGSEVGHPVRGVVAIIAATAPADDIFNGQFCGGVLISRGQVLTAAHCVVGREAGSIHAVVGADNLCRQARIDGTRTQVLDIATHPRYDPRAGRYDLATLRLEDLMPAGWERNPVPHPGGEQHAIALGWGRASAGGVPPCRLAQGRMTILPRAACEARFDDGDRRFDATSMVCAVPAVPGGRDTCTGDSGGPLILGNDLDAGPVVGVVSWGRGCGVGWPGVFARAGAWPDR